MIGKAALAVVILCVAVIVGTLGVLAMPAARAMLGSGPARTASYAVGTRIDVAPAVYESSEQTLIVFARYDCPAGQAAKRTLADLVSGAAKRPNLSVRLVTKAEFWPEELGFAREIGIPERDVVSADLRHLQLRVVPSLVLVDRKGVVIYALDGAPTSGDRDALLKEVLALTDAR